MLYDAARQWLELHCGMTGEPRSVPEDGLVARLYEELTRDVFERSLRASPRSIRRCNLVV
jgi:hypothetical protein